MTVVEPAPGPSLALPEEPAELRAQLRHAVLGGADWAGTFGQDLGLGEFLWSQWGPVLGPAGMDRAAMASVVAGYRRELWYWLLGDRIWPQVATGLAGRLLRRLPSG